MPKIKGMESVDNAFFLMALQHGVIAPTIFAMIFFYAIVSQLKFGLKAPPGESPIGFTFAGVYLVCLIAFTTVYMGAHTEPLIFLLLGWGESIKRRRNESAVVIGQAPVKAAAPRGELPTFPAFPAFPALPARPARPALGVRPSAPTSPASPFGRILY